MLKDYSKEVKELIKNYKKEDIRYDKPLAYLCQRNNLTKEEIENIIINCNNLYFTEMQEKPYETRYALFFIYSNNHGKCFVLSFNDKVKVATIYPMGRKTIRRYMKQRFKKS